MPVRTNAPIRLWLALAAALLVGACAAAALRAAEAPIVDETAVTAADLDAAQVRLDKADGLDAPIKEQAGKLIAQARLNLEAAQAKDRDTAAFKAAADGAPARLVQAKQEFEAAAGERPLAVSADSPLAAWDTEWETVKKEQEESQRELETLIAERKNRDKLKASIPTQLKPPVEERLREVQDQLAAAPPADEAPILTEAKRFELRSRRMLAQAELMMFDTQRASYLAREELIVARQDLVERRMVQLSAYVKRVQEGRQHRAEVEATQDTARQRAAARDAHPQLVETAKRNTDLTALRADLVKRTGRLQQALGEQQETLDALATELDDLREQEDKIGLTKALGELLRQRRPTLDGVLDYGIVGRVFTDAKPEDRTPRASDYRTLRRQIQEKFRALQFDRIPYEGERRSLTKDMAGAVRTLMDRVTTRLPEEVALQIEDEARKLLTGRRDILADLTRDYDTQFELLVELDSAVLELAEKTEEFQVYVDERVLWVRSTTTGPREAVTDALPALVWLLRPANWLEVA